MHNQVFLFDQFFETRNHKIKVAQECNYKFNCDKFYHLLTCQEQQYKKMANIQSQKKDWRKMYWKWVFFGSFAVGYYLWDFIRGCNWKRDYVKKINLLQQEMKMLIQLNPSRMLLEFTEATWQDHKKENFAGYTWRPSIYGKSEEIGKTIVEDGGKCQLMKTYFQKLNNRNSSLALVQAKNENFGNSTLGYQVLKVKYKCWGYDAHKKTYTIPMIYQDNQNKNGFNTAIIEENQHAFIECNEEKWKRLDQLT